MWLPTSCHTSLILLALFCVAINSKVTDSEVGSCDHAEFDGEILPGFDVVYPVIATREGVHPINTLHEHNQNHRRRVVIQVFYKGEKHRLKLEHNSKLMQSSSTRNHYQKADNCYYQGHCSKRDHRNDDVSVSTCDGLRGVIQIDGIAHIVYPAQAGDENTLCRPHFMYKMSPTKDRSCGNESGQWTPFERLYKSVFLNMMHKIPTENHRVKRDVELKYIELALIIDKSMYERIGENEDAATSFLLEVTNIIDMYYQSLNIRVGLSYFEHWNEDKFNISSNPRETLQNFLTFTKSELSEQHYDLIHLISAKPFDGESIGLAIPDSICTKRGVAVIHSQAGDNSRHLASVISHMIGHNIGLLHDEADCPCADEESGCIMSPIIRSRSPSKFSGCSQSRLNILTKVGLGSCLIEDEAVNPYPQSCGNGLIERGEQCDCGLNANCEKEHPCCDPSTCLLKFWAKCESGTCCENCLPKQSNEVCRAAKGECDATEHCDGVSGECPDDSVIANGEVCSGGYCYFGRCPSRDSQCKLYWESEAKSAHDECYRFNHVVGHGHCGMDVHGNPVKCDQRDSFCGLLQCEGGSSSPVDPQLSKRNTLTNLAGEEISCKAVFPGDGGDLANVGLVYDGTTCGDQMICLNHKCTNMTTVVAVSDCPQGDNNQTCSGNGRCTDIKTCSCNSGYRGRLCDEAIPTSSSRDSIVTVTGSSTDGSTVLDTKWLIVIICSVAAVVIVAAVLAFLFCRRQIVSPSHKRLKKRNTSHLNESVDLEKDSTIRFGLTPSYRSEKDGKRKRRRKRRPSSSGEDDTDSDERNPGNARLDIAIPEELSRQPERGILKKTTSSAFEGIEDECCNSQCSCSDSGSCSCTDNEQLADEPDNASNGQEAEQEIPPPLEFDTNIYAQRFETSVQVEVNPCHEISPTESEDMRYCATEADQYYKNFGPSAYDRYNSVHQLQHGGGDSATDSAIDMPGDGSVSTINEIPPHHSTSILSSYYKHTPTVSDYADLHSQSDQSPNDTRSKVYRPSKYAKPTIASVLGQGQHKPATADSLHPVIYEYNKPPVNRSLAESGSRDSRPSPQSKRLSRSSSGSRRRGDDSVVTV